MARIDSLGNFLTDVADAIRGMTGSSDLIDAENFDTAIADIPTEGEVFVEVDTEAGMDSLLNVINEGKTYKYTGTPGKYQNAIYQIDKMIEDKPSLNQAYFCPSDTYVTHTLSIECTIGAKLIAFISIRDTNNYSVDSSWEVLGLSDDFPAEGTHQYMIVACKTATSTNESITVTQGSAQRMYINIIELPSSASFTFEGFQYQSGNIQDITIVSQTGNKLCGLSSPLWTVTEIHRP